MDGRPGMLGGRGQERRGCSQPLQGLAVDGRLILTDFIWQRPAVYAVERHGPQQTPRPSGTRRRCQRRLPPSSGMLRLSAHLRPFRRTSCCLMRSVHVYSASALQARGVGVGLIPPWVFYESSYTALRGGLVSGTPSPLLRRYDL